MSKERRAGPQVQAGLLVDPGGFPLEVHRFEGNKAETATVIPVLSAFAQRHGVRDMVVVADAEMLSAANLNAPEDAGFGFIVGSRITKHLTTWPGTSNGTAITSLTGRSWSRPGGWATPPGSGGWPANGSSSASSMTTRPSTRAEKIADRRAPLKKARFLKVTGATTELDQVTIDRACQLAGLKGYVTNLPASKMDGAAVIAGYHDLWKVEQSFRMTKGDLRARPVFHHQREAIEAHMTSCSPPVTCRTPPAPASRRSSRPCVRHAQQPSISTASASPSTPTSPTRPTTSSSGSKQVTKRLARVRPEHRSSARVRTDRSAAVSAYYLGGAAQGPAGQRPRNRYRASEPCRRCMRIDRSTEHRYAAPTTRGT